MKNHIQMNLYFIPTNEGGRKNPVKSGYNTQFHFISPTESANDWTISLNFEGQESVNPGTSTSARGVFLCPEIVSKIKNDMPFELREGTRKIAEGKIVDCS